MITTTLFCILTGKCDNSGRQDQIFAFTIPAVDNDTISSPNVTVTTSSRIPVKVTLSIPNLSFEKNTSVDRYHNYNISLPPSILFKQGEGKQNKTIIVRSSGMVSVHVIENDGRNGLGDGFIVYPTDQIGKRYYVAAYSPNFSKDLPFFSVTALEHARITVKTKSGQLLSEQLKRYESYRFDGDALQDISGTFIQSDSPITVISGVRTWVPSGRCCDGNLLEQLLPVSKWKKNYFLASFKYLNSFIYRVYSSDLSTSVNISISDGENDQIEIAAEDFYEGDIDGDKMLSITSEEAVMVVQYMITNTTTFPSPGSPAMVLAQPDSSFISTVTFPVFGFFSLGESSFYYYISVIIECSQITGLIINGTISERDRLASFDKSMCVVRGLVYQGLYSVYHIDSNIVFSVSVYAYGKFSTVGSYAYLANTGIRSSGEYSKLCVLQHVFTLPNFSFLFSDNNNNNHIILNVIGQYAAESFMIISCTIRVHTFINNLPESLYDYNILID